MNDKIQSRRKGRLEVKEFHSKSSGVFFKVQKILYDARSQFQRIEVIENDHFGKVLLLDGLVQTTEKDEFFYHEMLVHPAFVVHPSAKNVLIIGGGDGGSLKEVLRYPVHAVDLVEIDPLVIDVSKEHFPWLNPCLKDGRVNLFILDGGEYIQNVDKKFDVIIVDSSEPVGPSLSLHQEIFYRGLKDRLSPQGIVLAQVGSPFYQLGAIATTYDTTKNIFNFARFYLAPVPTYPGGSWCFVYLSGIMDPLVIKKNPPPGLKYFDLDIHKAAFCLPPFIEDRLKKESST